MAAYVYPLITAIGLSMEIWGIRLFEQAPQVDRLLLMMVAGGVTYDSLVISMGRLIGQNIWLERLNRLRFLLHDLLVPLLIVVAVQIAGRAGIGWMTRISDWSWILSLGLIGFGLWVNYRRLELKPACYAGTIRYIAQTFSPIPVILTTLSVGAVGASIWLGIRWPWLLIGSLLVLIGNAVPSRVGGPLLGAMVELAFLTTLMATEAI